MFSLNIEKIEELTRKTLYTCFARHKTQHQRIVHLYILIAQRALCGMEMHKFFICQVVEFFSAELCFSQGGVIAIDFRSVAEHIVWGVRNLCRVCRAICRWLHSSAKIFLCKTIYLTYPKVYFLYFFFNFFFRFFTCSSKT